MLPNFLIIGSQKAGTTSLYHALRQHPQVFMSAEKEPNFFFHDHLYQRGLAAYQTHFNGADSFAAIGEASPGYICHPAAPARICAAIPDAKLIVTVREPVARAYSQYWDSRRKLSVGVTFEQAFRDHFSTRFGEGQHGFFSRGFYWQYIEAYLHQFAREQLLVLIAERLAAQPHAVYAQICNFLGIERIFSDDILATRRNTPRLYANLLYQFFYHRPAMGVRLPRKVARRLFFGRKIPVTYPPLDPTLHAEIATRYHEANNQLRQFLGDDLEEWG